MSDYFIRCCKEHAAGMEARELSLENQINVLTAKLEAIIEERKNLKFGIINWEEEEGQPGYE